MDKWQEYEAAKRKLRQRERDEDFDYEAEIQKIISRLGV